MVNCMNTTVKTRIVDVAVIGAGTAGLAAYRAARRGGASAVIIEGGPYGTTCARVGCMPSKLLIAAAEGMHAQERLEAFGIDVPPAKVDGVRVMDRVRSERDRFVGFVLEGVDSIDANDRIRGYASFVDAHTLTVPLEDGSGDLTIQAKSIVIATGSSPNKPELLQPAGDRLIVNDDIFYWTHLPKSVFVVGAGVIGLELGQALSRLGVTVTLLGRSNHIALLSDPVVTDEAIRIFKDEMHYVSNGSVVSVKRVDEGVEVIYQNDQGAIESTVVEYVISTAGRRVNLDKINLGATGIPLNDKGVPEFDKETMQIGDTHAFIAGDANADLPLLHEAADEGLIAGVNAAKLALGQTIEEGHRRTPLGIVFSDPNIAIVGQLYKTLDLTQTAVGQVSFHNQGRSRVMLVNKGILRVYADLKTREFLGAEMIGPRNEHIAHLLAWSHQMDLTIDQMLDMPFYHPVVEEGLRTALRDLQSQLDSQTPIQVA